MRYFVIISFLGILSLFQSIYASEINSIQVPLVEVIPNIDGKFSTETEWDAKNTINFNSNDHDFYLLTKQNNQFVYLMFDGVDFQTDPKRNDLSVRYQVTLCFDGNNDKSSKRESGDFCHTSTVFNEFGKEVKTLNAPIKFDSNGKSSHLDLPNKFQTGWSYGSQNNPFVKSDHLMFEVQIPRSLFESLGDVGFTFEMYAGSSTDDLVQLVDGIKWPPESDKNNPSTWGQLVLPEIYCPENLKLAYKASDHSRVCVKDQSISKLIERGWALSAELSNHKISALDTIKNHPIIKAFHAKYSDTVEEIKSDHISYVSGSDDGFKVRMKVFFDESYNVNNMNFNCFYQRTHLVEIPQEDISYFLKNRDCEEFRK